MTKLFCLFDKHKNNIVVLLTLGKSKKILPFFYLWASQKNIFVLLTLGKSKKILSLC